MTDKDTLELELRRAKKTYLAALFAIAGDRDEAMVECDELKQRLAGVTSYQPIHHGLPTDDAIKHVACAPSGLGGYASRYDAWFNLGQWWFVDHTLDGRYTVTHWKDREEVPDE
jgi:hypothetical protein